MEFYTLQTLTTLFKNRQSAELENYLREVHWGKEYSFYDATDEEAN